MTAERLTLVVRRDRIRDRLERGRRGDHVSSNLTGLSHPDINDITVGYDGALQAITTTGSMLAQAAKR